MSQRQDNQNTQATPREDELLGVIADVEKYWMNEIKDANGKPLFAMTN